MAEIKNKMNMNDKQKYIDNHKYCAILCYSKHNIDIAGETMPKTDISLSPKAVEVANELLSNGSRVQIDFNPKTRELAIYEIPRMKTKYKVVVTGG